MRPSKEAGMDAANPTNRCCGQDGSWSPTHSNPVNVACKLCPQSPTYWRQGFAEPYIAQPLRFDVDPAVLTARLAEIAADENWPTSLRAAARDAGTELEVPGLTDDAIATALTARLRAGHRQP
jgi:hypothetical protein